jgi:hypothetical protein
MPTWGMNWCILHVLIGTIFVCILMKKENKVRKKHDKHRIIYHLIITAVFYLM